MKIALPWRFPFTLVVVISLSIKPVATHPETAGLVSVGRKQHESQAMFLVLYIGKFLAKISLASKLELSHKFNMIQHDQVLIMFPFQQSM